MNRNINEKQKKAIIHAINEAKKTTLWNVVDSVFLFGSCARGNSRYNSDVDLLFLIDNDISNYHNQIISFLGRITANRDGMSEIDAVVDEKHKFYSSNRTFEKNIKKDMILLYKKEVKNE